MSLQVLYNSSYGGFNFSDAAVKRYNELAEMSGAEKVSGIAYDMIRTDRIMVMVLD
jgi:hypothetical protein